MESFQEVGGHKLRVYEEGRGPPIIFLYDAWHTAVGAEPLGVALTPRFHTLSFDLPAFGGSPVPKDFSLGLPDYARLVTKFLEQCGPREITLVLADIGVALGLVALGLEDGALDRVGHVVLLNGLMYGESPGHGPLRRTALFSRWDLPMNRMGHRRKILQLCGTPDALDEGMAIRAWDPFRAGTYNAQFHLTSEMTESDEPLRAGRQALAEQDVPTMLLWGEDDPSGGRVVAERAQADFPEAEIYLLPNVGHFPHIEATEVVAEAVEGFVKRTRRPVVPRTAKADLALPSGTE